ncbi:MgtC/SapB family protein [Candidatus Bealeia paramacronuclearis]
MTEISYFTDILFAFFLGASIGWERAMSGKDAGIRTFGFICTGSCVFTIISELLYVDSSRMIANIIMGISFVAGGVIWRSLETGGSTHGLTTAASLWLTAGIGIMVGSHFYALSLCVTVLALVVLHVPYTQFWKKYFALHD